MKKVLTLAFIIYSFCVFSQTLQNDVVASAGGSDTTVQYIVSWTVGESFIETYSNSDCITTQGFHQLFFSISEIPETIKTPFAIKIYPNPAVDFINVEVHSEDLNDEYKIELLDMYGHLIEQYQTNHTKITRIDLKNTSDGFLVMNITNLETKLRKTFKIIKTSY